MNIKIERGIHNVPSHSYRGQYEDIRCHIITIPIKDLIREVFAKYKDITCPEHYYTTIDILRRVKKVKAFYYERYGEEQIELYLACPSKTNKRFDTLISFSDPVLELDREGKYNVDEYKGIPFYVFEDLKEDILNIIMEELRKEGVKYAC